MVKGYPKYKYSGTSWFGDVPNHWQIVPLFALAKLKKIVNCVDRELLSVYLNLGVIRFKDVDEKRTNVTSEDLSKYQAVDPGDFVLNNQQAWRGSVGVSKYKGIVSPAYLVLHLSDTLVPEYANYLFRNHGMVTQYLVASKGVGSIQRNLYWPYLKRSIVIYPSNKEQEAIVRFLDNVEVRVRRYIRAKQQVIKLLNEQKRAIINKAVTCGIDSNVRLKPSGVDWLGDIPEHWEVRRIKSLSTVKRGASPRPIADSRYFDDNGEYSWVRIEDVTASIYYLENTKQKLSLLGQSLSVALEPGSLFLSIAGSVGKPIITKIKCCIHDGFVYFPSFKGNTEFLCRVFASGRLYEGLGKLGTQLNLNTETVGSIKIGWPPSEEQSEIVEFINKETEGMDSAITFVQNEIKLTHEYRTRFISDVVTGKIDVRNIGLPEVEEISEPEPIEEQEIPEDMDGTEEVVNADE